ncbi:beta-lactamase [Candidatus Pelagibacter sp. HTCC7211]|uniref:serine hydrolase domain-containing protein n=1 Tax=Pelagibacter sp. (strain HTCC7211) TaxID=439493 RepID=UPI000183B73C|nr:serine hydrolase [Candidatus Pelagibacter sp. HTCC7211]EDZ60542.1 beta-lactamase [Candidatus Pelagibacter sp. HTCC7211]MBD1151349.1 serine hydrolase [Pelagibacterales bacterium SAG-MED25]
MYKKKIFSEPNPSLKIIRDNKPKWYLPETRREGYRNLHKINRYGLLFRSDQVLTLNTKYNPEIEKIISVQKMISHKYFCSLLVGKDQDILFEKYADDFSEHTPQTIMSITKMFVNLFIGELVEKNIIDLNKTVSEYLPNINSGYASAKIQDVLDMNIQNSYSEDYTDPYTSSFLHEPVCGWRLPNDQNYKIVQEEFLNSIESIKGETLENKNDLSHYKSANTDVLGVIIEKVSGKKLKDWLLEAVEAAGFEDAMYMGTDRDSMPWISGGGCLISRDFLRYGLLFSRKGHGVENRKVGSEKFLSETLTNKGTKYMELSTDKYLYYSNSSMKCGDWIGHSGLGGQFLAINLKNGIVASYFSVIETDSGTDENYKRDMINMLDEIVNKNF